MEVLEQVKTDIITRMNELKPLIEEYYELEEIHKRLNRKPPGRPRKEETDNAG